jgi:octopine/nopaline transport system substrate-binding protein
MRSFGYRGVLAALALAVGFALPSAQAKDWKKLTIATEGAYMPYNGHAPDGKLIGFEIDLAKELCARMKVQCEVIAQDWNGIIPGLTGGKYDAIMAGMSITPKRREVIAFSRPYVAAPSTFAVPKGGALAGLPETGVRVSLDDKAAMDAEVAKLTPLLKGKVIGAQVSTIQADLLNTYFKGVATIRTYPTTEEHDLDLEAGRLDAALASTSYFVSTLAKAGDQLQLSGPLFTGGLLGAGVGVGLRKGDADLKTMFDSAIEAALKDGTIKKLAVQWFKTDISAPM